MVKRFNLTLERGQTRCSNISILLLISIGLVYSLHHYPFTHIIYKKVGAILGDPMCLMWP